MQEFIYFQSVELIKSKQDLLFLGGPYLSGNKLQIGALLCL